MQTYTSTTHKGAQTDTKLAVTSQELIGVLIEEYVQRQRRAGKPLKKETIHQSISGKPSLLGRMTTNTAVKCDNCGLRNHETKNCKWLHEPKCGICDRFGHTTEDCYSRKAENLKRK